MGLDPSTPIPEVISACPCCRTPGSLVPFELTYDIDNELTRLTLCQSCLALFNLNAYAELKQSKPEQIQVGDFYAVNGFGGDDHLAAIKNAGDNLVGYFLRRTGLDPAARTFCEIGAGRGYAALAAARRFKSAYALDFDLRNFERVCQEIGRPANLHIGRSLEYVNSRIDILMGWHVLEHIPEPLAFLDQARRRMAPRAYFFFQVPMYRPAYLVRSHHVFYNETAMGRLMTKAGAEVIEIGFDPKAGFLTAIAQLRS